MTHPVIARDNVAVVTGGASGIGLASAKRLSREGMKVAIVDRSMDALAAALDELTQLAGGEDRVTAAACDVTDRAGMEKTAAHVETTLGPVQLLMNNAGIQSGSSIFGDQANWDAVLSVDLGGVITGTRVFGPRMMAHGAPGIIINTGSKQGITTPPGDPAYNVAKAGVKVFTEALEHELRNRPECKVRAALLVPGFVFTPLTAKGRAEKPAGAWSADETVDFMLERLGQGDFYILCPDNEVSRETDARRILWAAGDLVENRPPLSRWHPDHAEAFEAFSRS